MTSLQNHQRRDFILLGGTGPLSDSGPAGLPKGELTPCQNTHSVLHDVLRGNALNLLHGVGGHIHTAGLALTGHQQLVVLLVSYRRNDTHVQQLKAT